MKTKEDIIWWVLVAALSGIANYLNEVSNDRKKFKWLLLISHYISAAIAGYVAGGILSSTGLSQEMVYPLVAVAGWVGPLLLDEVGKGLARLLPEVVSRVQLAALILIEPSRAPEHVRQHSTQDSMAREQDTPVMSQESAEEIPETREERKARLQAQRNNNC